MACMLIIQDPRDQLFAAPYNSSELRVCDAQHESMGIGDGIGIVHVCMYAYNRMHTRIRW